MKRRKAVSVQVAPPTPPAALPAALSAVMTPIATISTGHQTIRLTLRSPEDVPLDKKGTAPAGIRGELAKVNKRRKTEDKALKDPRAIEAAAKQLKITFKPIKNPSAFKEN